MSQTEYDTDTNDPKERLHQFGESFRRLRLARNISQETLASRCGLGLSTVKRLERGQGCNLAALLQMLAALGCAEQFAAMFAGLAADIGSVEDRVKGNVKTSAQGGAQGSAKHRRRASAPRSPGRD